MVLETGIFTSHAIWLWRVRHIRQEAKKAGKTYDEYVSEHPSKKILNCESAETVVDLEACEKDKETDTVPGSEKGCDFDKTTGRSGQRADAVLSPPTAVFKA